MGFLNPVKDKQGILKMEGEVFQNKISISPSGMLPAEVPRDQ